MRGIYQTLVLTGAVTAAQMTQAMARFGDTSELERHLVDEGVVTEWQLAEAVAAHTGHRAVDISGAVLDPQTIALVPVSLSRRYRILPLERAGSRLILAMVDPTDIIAIDDVTSVTDLRVEPVVVAADALRQAFERYLRSDEELSDLSEQIGETNQLSAVSFTETLDDQDVDAPVVRFVNLLIAQAINDRASDIHVEPGEHQLTVRFRIDGVLHEMQRADRGIQDGIISRLKIMSSIDIAERRRPQDGRLSVHHEGRQIDLRVATLPTVWGEKIVMRILDNTGQSMAMTDMNMAAGNLARFEKAIHRPHGMVLLPDPVGQVHDALHGAERRRQPARECDHGRGSRGVPDRRRQPGAGEQSRGPHLRGGTPLHPAERPRHRAGG